MNEIADRLETLNFPEALRLYVDWLRNTRDYSAWADLATTGTTTISVTMMTPTQLKVEAIPQAPIDDYEATIKKLQEELASANETITEQAQTIQTLEAEAKAAAPPKVTKRKTQSEST